MLRFFALMLLFIFLDPHYNMSMAAVDKPKLEKSTYIVHMTKSEMPAIFTDHTQWYASNLRSVSELAEMIYTYNSVIHGFSTRLTEQEANSLKGRPGVLAVLPQVRYELHTTRTPMFLGLNKYEALVPKSETGSEIIIGVVDTGVWPESQSYNDKGLGPVPSRWKGVCEVGTNFNASNCNRKLIGARFFCEEYEANQGHINETQESKSPRDDIGHGTHTSTTAAGSAVEGASLYGYAKGMARGMASQARISVYKVCWLGGCFDSDIMAGIDKAIEDGVNIISMSLGNPIDGFDYDYYQTSLSIGAFAAMERGIFVSCSAGNSGPDPSSVTNFAPWITTVGAGTLDRNFPASVILGNGKNFSGVSLYSGDPLPNSPLKLIYGANASYFPNGHLCERHTLIPSRVAGKIVLCDGSEVLKGLLVKDAGGAGMILVNEFFKELRAEPHFLPATMVDHKNGDMIKEYIRSHTNPTATIVFQGTKVGIKPSPVVAEFSSRGPNPKTPEILKPDIIAPGVDILAGWSGTSGPTGQGFDTRHVDYNIISGTSMSCPHVSGLAALLKAAHPDWTPGVIRSALMTTAYTTYKNGAKIEDIATGKAATPFDYGAGHVDPILALDPGLVYELGVQDYIDFLCALGYSKMDILMITKRSFRCDTSKAYSVTDLNYPSFSVSLLASNKGGVTTTVKHTRTLTNVGSPATYNVSVSSEMESVKISVQPQSLRFSKVNEKKMYTVMFTATSMPSGTNSFGRLEWTDGKHIVGSSIAFSWA